MACWTSSPPGKRSPHGAAALGHQACCPGHDVIFTPAQVASPPAQCHAAAQSELPGMLIATRCRRTSADRAFGWHCALASARAASRPRRCGRGSSRSSGPLASLPGQSPSSAAPPPRRAEATTPPVPSGPAGRPAALEQPSGARFKTIDPGKYSADGLLRRLGGRQGSHDDAAQRQVPSGSRLTAPRDQHLPQFSATVDERVPSPYRAGQADPAARPVDIKNLCFYYLIS